MNPFASRHSWPLQTPAMVWQFEQFLDHSMGPQLYGTCHYTPPYGTPAHGTSCVFVGPVLYWVPNQILSSGPLDLHCRPDVHMMHHPRPTKQALCAFSRALSSQSSPLVSLATCVPTQGPGDIAICPCILQVGNQVYLQSQYVTPGSMMPSNLGQIHTSGALIVPQIVEPPESWITPAPITSQELLDIPSRDKDILEVTSQEKVMKSIQCMPEGHLSQTGQEGENPKPALQPQPAQESLPTQGPWSAQRPQSIKSSLLAQGVRSAHRPQPVQRPLSAQIPHPVEEPQSAPVTPEGLWNTLNADMDILEVREGNEDDPMCAKGSPATQRPRGIGSLASSGSPANPRAPASPGTWVTSEPQPANTNACVQLQRSNHSAPANTSSEMDFFYDVSSFGYLCDFQVFGQPVPFVEDQDNTEDSESWLDYICGSA